jgi:hypothetical protein
MAESMLLPAAPIFASIPARGGVPTVGSILPVAGIVFDVGTVGVVSLTLLALLLLIWLWRS